MAIDVSITLVDDYQRTSTKKFESTATLLADAETALTALWADLAAVSQMGALNRTFSDTAVFSQAVDAGANVDAGGTLHCRLNNGKMYALKIPAIDPALVNADGTIDISATAITDYVANFESTGSFRVSEGNYIVSIVRGELDR